MSPVSTLNSCGKRYNPVRNSHLPIGGKRRWFNKIRGCVRNWSALKSFPLSLTRHSRWKVEPLVSVNRTRLNTNMSGDSMSSDKTAMRRSHNVLTNKGLSLFDRSRSERPRIKTGFPASVQTSAQELITSTCRLESNTTNLAEDCFRHAISQSRL